jgi:hypothetical protein
VETKEPMPYNIREVEDKDSIRHQATQPIPIGPAFSKRTAERAARLIVTGSGIQDEGPDWTKWELLDENGKTFACKMIPGY